MANIIADQQVMLEQCASYLDYFCSDIGQRPVGSQGNRQATGRFKEIVESFGWEVESTPFPALDWKEGGAECWSGKKSFQVYPAPYSLPCLVKAELAAASTLAELEELNCRDKILLLHGELAREQLMPKNFIFFNPEEHRRIISTLESKNPAAILGATARNPALAGGVYPFPLIEDGDFMIPTVYLTEEEGRKLLGEVGREVSLISRSQRLPGTAWDLTARKGQSSSRRIAISAHIDAKKGTPGAIDNASGVVVLLLLAELLANYDREPDIELLPFNGEDYYAAPGQMLFLEKNQNRWDEILININIDGAGYLEGFSAFSPINLLPGQMAVFKKTLANFPGIVEGAPWVQGDHSIFIQHGVPAVAVSSQWFIDHLDSQQITHTPADHPGIVDCQKLVEISRAIEFMILNMGDESDG